MPTSKINWISILQGWAMLLVVLGHCWVWTSNEWCFHFCYGVHMPLFMFVSGGLFYLTRINRNWAWRDVVVDKLKRLGVPYLFFITFAFGLKVLMAGHVKHGVDLSLGSFLMGIVYPMQSGMKEMWFVAALLVLMFCYPLWRCLLAMGKKMEVFVLVVGIALTFLIPSYTGGGLLNWQGALRYMVFFFGGMMFFKYDCVKYIKIRAGGVILIALYSATCIYRREQAFLVATIGIAASVWLCCWASRRLPNLFSSFRDYSFQIFLLGIYPQMFVELILGKRFVEPWQQMALLGISVLLGIYFSVGVAKMARKIDNKYLNMVLGIR